MSITTMESNEANIHHLGEHLINVQSAVNELTKQNVKQTEDISEVKEQVNKIYTGFAGDKKLGIKGLPERLREQEEAIVQHHEELLTFKQEYQKDKTKHGRVAGFLVAIGVIFGGLIKMAFAKLSLLF